MVTVQIRENVKTLRCRVTEMSGYRDVRLQTCRVTDMSENRDLRLQRCPESCRETEMSGYRNVGSRSFPCTATTHYQNSLRICMRAIILVKRGHGNHFTYLNVAGAGLE